MIRRIFTLFSYYIILLSIGCFGDSLIAKPNLLASLAECAGRFSQKRLIELARDPAHNHKITENSLDEAKIALTLESYGHLVGVRRDPSGGADFMDSSNQYWDVKSYRSDLPNQKGDFNINVAIEQIKLEISLGNNVILNVQNLTIQDQLQLRNAVLVQRISSHILFYPPH